LACFARLLHIHPNRRNDERKHSTLREVLRARGIEGANPLSARRDMKNIIMAGVAVLSLCMAIGAMGSAAATWSLTLSPQQIDDWGRITA
jgi:hypothetical protein